MSVFAIRNFKFLGFALGKNGKGVFIRVHAESMKKAKVKLKFLSSRRNVQNIQATLAKLKRYMQGWLGYYGIADMKKSIEELNQWLRHRIRMCIWKQWKLPRTKMRKLIGLGISEENAFMTANNRRKHWHVSGGSIVNFALSNKRLINWGYYDLTQAYQSLHVNY